MHWAFGHYGKLVDLVASAHAGNECTCQTFCVNGWMPWRRLACLSHTRSCTGYAAGYVSHSTKRQCDMFILLDSAPSATGTSVTHHDELLQQDPSLLPSSQGATS